MLSTPGREDDSILENIAMVNIWHSKISKRTEESFNNIWNFSTILYTETIRRTLTLAMFVRNLVLLPRKLSLGVSLSLDRDTGCSGEGEASVSCGAKINPKWNCPTNFTEPGNFPLSLFIAFLSLPKR
jgi:hypothetical protein